MTSFLTMPFFATVLPSWSNFGGLLAQANDHTLTQSYQASPLTGVIGLVIGLISIVSLWIIFSKASEPGWACIIPIYNLYILCRIAGKSGWWVLLLFIPIVNFIAYILVAVGLARSFGKGVGFGIGIVFLSFIFLPILAFGDARYEGSA